MFESTCRESYDTTFKERELHAVIVSTEDQTRPSNICASVATVPADLSHLERSRPFCEVCDGGIDSAQLFCGAFLASGCLL